MESQVPLDALLVVSFARIYLSLRQPHEDVYSPVWWVRGNHYALDGVQLRRVRYNLGEWVEAT